MSVTSLTGTTWVINVTPVYSPFTKQVISSLRQTNIRASITAGGATYDYISVLVNSNKLSISYGVNGGNSTTVYTQDNGWTSYSFRTVAFSSDATVSGNYDATTAETIEWLEANAVQVVPDVDVDVSLGNTSIASLSNTGSVTLATQNTYLTDDITINYTKSGGIVPSGTISIASNGTYDVASYASAFVNVSGGGEDTVVPFIENHGTMTSFAHSSITKIGQGAFAYCSSLTTASFPSCTSIESYAFYSCSKLTTASFPLCETIGGSAFYNCSSLTTASFPSCTSIMSSAFGYCSKLTTASFPLCKTIGGSAFYNCSSLTTISFPSCTSIGNYAFYGCNKLSSISFPSCTSIWTYAFGYCNNLTTVSFPSCTSIDQYAFYSCKKLSSISFPSCTSIGMYAFYSCLSLTTVSFPSCTRINNSAFYRCYNLVSLYLLGSSIPSLSNSNAFSSTPIAGYTTSTGGVYGKIYVPSSLYSSYKTATNWTYFSSRFVSV